MIMGPLYSFLLNSGKSVAVNNSIYDSRCQRGVVFHMLTVFYCVVFFNTKCWNMPSKELRPVPLHIQNVKLVFCISSHFINWSTFQKLYIITVVNWFECVIKKWLVQMLLTWKIWLGLAKFCCLVQSPAGKMNYNSF